MLSPGRSRGIGLGIAKGFAEAGARLHLLADDQEVMTAASELHAMGHVVDITDAASVAAFFESLPVVDVLINNAGLERLTPLDDMSDDAAAIFVGSSTSTSRAPIWSRAPPCRKCGGQPDYQHELGMGKGGRTAFRRLCRLQTCRYRAH